MWFYYLILFLGIVGFVFSSLRFGGRLDEKNGSIRVNLVGVLSSAMGAFYLCILTFLPGLEFHPFGSGLEIIGVISSTIALHRFKPYSEKGMGLRAYSPFASIAAIFMLAVFY